MSDNNGDWQSHKMWVVKDLERIDVSLAKLENKITTSTQDILTKIEESYKDLDKRITANEIKHSKVFTVKNTVVYIIMLVISISGVAASILS